MHDSLTLAMHTDVLEWLGCNYFLPCHWFSAHIRSAFILLAYLYPDSGTLRLLSLFC